MKRLKTACLAFLFVITVARALPAASLESGNTSTVTLDKRTQVPGEALKPGNYSIQIVDHLTDRVIIRVESEVGKVHAIFLAVPSSPLNGGGPQVNGVIFWGSTLNGVPAIRGFRFPSGYTVEFVYPKSEAATLAKANQGKVLAVDPESEGRPTLPHLTSDDLQMIHLWMLSLTTAGPDSKTPAILAQAYKAPAQITSVQTAPIQVASNEVPAAPQGASHQVTRIVRPVSPDTKSPARQHAVITTLPHTASSLPAFAFAAFSTLFLALFIHYRLERGRI